ncbi:MAG: cytidylate kinase-like family protein [Candidatus Hinthialibacter antarcticus]|nr:cytidylate kinase-like family protein [Candidatus Hinthialibacter antarcticus]
MSNLQQMLTRQINQWNLERQAVQELQSSDSSSIGVRAADQKPVVTLSRERGCRGQEIAKLLSHELQYGFFGRQVIDYIAEHLGVRSELVESLDEKDRSELELWVGNLFSDHAFDHDEYSHALSEVMRAISLQGGLVVIGRGANYILRNANAFHVRVIAPVKTRIRNLLEQEGMSEAQAHAEIKRVDNERKQFVKRYFHQDINNPIFYDLVINAEHLQIHSITKTVIAAMRARGWSLAYTGGDKRRRTA